jgi:hypothetical protein
VDGDEAVARVLRSLQVSLGAQRDGQEIQDARVLLVGLAQFSRGRGVVLVGQGDAAGKLVALSLFEGDALHLRRS